MANESVLVDTGALAALFDPADQYHDACKAAAGKLPLGKAFTCWPVLTEACYLLRRYPAQRDGLIQSVYDGEFQVLPLHRGDLPAIQDVFESYHDQKVDLADASLVVLADRVDVERIFTVDVRHFSLFRRRNGRPFFLLPEFV
jgi:predicted nucleic acid-binding protein